MSKDARLLEWVQRTGMLLESQVVFAGMSRALNRLLQDGAVEIVAHPTVRERVGVPAAAVVLREARHD